MPFGRNFISISQISALYGEVTWKGRSKRTSYFSKTQRRILFLTLYISAVVPAMYTHTHPFNGLIPLTFRLKVEERSQAYKLLCQCGRQRTRKQRCGGPMFVNVVDVSRGEMQLLDDLTRKEHTFLLYFFQKVGLLFLLQECATLLTLALFTI